MTSDFLNPIIEVRTRKWFPFVSFIRCIIPGIIFTGLFSVILYMAVWFVLSGIAVLLEHWNILPSSFEEFVFFFEDIIYGWIPYLFIFVLGFVVTGFYAFYVQNIRIVVDGREVSFWRGKRKYRSFLLAENTFGSELHHSYYFFFFKGPPVHRFLIVDQRNGKRVRKYQCFGVSEKDFNQLLNHLWFGKRSKTREEHLKDCSCLQKIEEEHSTQKETSAYPLTHHFAIDKETYLRRVKRRILVNFSTLLVVPVTFVAMMLLLRLPAYVIEEVFRNSLPGLAVISVILLGFIIYQNLKEKKIIVEIRRTAPSYIAIDEERLIIGSDLGEVVYFLKHITELRATPPSYITTNNLRLIRRYVTITNYDGHTRRFLVGEADKSKWLYWVSLQRSKENVFIDYENFCETMLHLLRDENRFKLDLEQF